jgi:CubicO group peptidase (beta-lactamase class C family)
MQPVDRADAPARAVDALMQPFVAPASPGAAIAVVVGGEVVHLKGYGLANIEHGIGWTADTVVFAGSVTKHFTAVAILLLEQAGLLHLDDPVAAHLPGLPDYGAELTLRHLLNNTSGLVDQDALMGMAGILDESPCSLDYMYQIAIGQRRLQCLPGRHFFYCNTPFMLLTRIIEQKSGLAIGAFLRQHIFAPLGMHDSSAPRGHKDVIAHAATGYTAESDGSFRVYRILPDCSGDGAMRSTTADMVRWVRNLRQDRLGIADLVNRLTETPAFSDPAERSLYGVGTMVTEHRGMTGLGHTGSGGGFKTHFFQLPEADLAVVFMANRHDALEMLDVTRVADIFLPAPAPAPCSAIPPAATFTDAELAGCYLNAETGYFLDVSPGDDGLVVSIVGDRDIAVMRHVGADCYRPLHGAFSLPMFVTAAPDACIAINLDGVRDLMFRRVIAEETTAADADAAGGLYYNETIASFVSIERRDGALWLRRGRGETMFHWHRMRRLGSDAFRADYVGVETMWRFKTYAVRLRRGNDGAVAAVALSIGRARDIVFERKGG